ncbi:hypothetical protein Nmel_014516, partial [Mimus melanotis]
RPCVKYSCRVGNSLYSKLNLQLLSPCCHISIRKDIQSAASTHIVQMICRRLHSPPAVLQHRGL